MFYLFIFEIKIYMRKVFLTSIMFLFFQGLNAQIADLKVENGVVKIYNEKGQLNSSTSSSGKEILGFAGTFWVWKNSNNVYYTVDENCKVIASKTISNNVFKSVGGNSMTFTYNGVTYIYDKNFKRTN